MAFPSPPPPPKSSSALLFFLLLLIASAANGASSTIKSKEFDDMLQSLRNYGYTLFTNSIATSDLKYQLLAASASATSNFTLFAPRDELLYALDMATDAAVYVSTLRYHIVPNRRHTFADLKNLSAPFLDTLLPHFAVLVGKVRDVDVSNDRASVGVIVDGVRLSFPDLFVGSRIVVHGIDGILLTGLNMSRDPGANDTGSDHIPPVRSPVPGVDANIPPENQAPTSQFGRNNVSPAPASAFDGNIPADVHAPTDQFGWNYVAPAPASAFDGNIPAEVHAPTDQFGWTYVAPAPASAFHGNIPAEGPLGPNSQFDSNNVPVAPVSNRGNIPAEWIPIPNAPTPPASNADVDIPSEGTLIPNVPVAPVSNRGNISAEWIPIPNAPTPPASNADVDIPSEGTLIPNVPTPPASNAEVDIPSKRNPTNPTSKFDRNHVLAPPAFTIPAKGRSNIPAKGRSTNPASRIGRNHVPSAPAAGTLTSPRSHFHWSNIPAAATPKITKDPIEKMKRYRRKHPGKAQQKGRRHHHHHRRRRRAVGDL